MHPARHSETAERKESGLPNRGFALSKMTNHEQELGVTVLGGGPLLPAFVKAAHFSPLPVAPVKGLEPGRGDPGRDGGVNGGKLRWGWGRIVR